MDKTVSGYLSFANDLSNKRFESAVCQLSKSELDSLSKLLPFNLRTEFSLDELDDVEEIIMEGLPDISDL